MTQTELALLTHAKRVNGETDRKFVGCLMSNAWLREPIFLEDFGKDNET